MVVTPPLTKLVIGRKRARGRKRLAARRADRVLIRMRVVANARLLSWIALAISAHSIATRQRRLADGAARHDRVEEDLRSWVGRHPTPILYVTHSHREAFELGQQMLVIENGRIVARGTPHEVLDAPARFGVANIAGFENVFPARVQLVDAAQGTMSCLIGADTQVEVPFSA